MIGLGVLPVFIELVISTPVIYENNWVAIHGRCVTTAAAKVRNSVLPLLWCEPNAGFAPHPLRAMLPRVETVACRWGSFVHQ
jgi:hypothetical protein